MYQTVGDILPRILSPFCTSNRSLMHYCQKQCCLCGMNWWGPKEERWKVVSLELHTKACLSVQMLGWAVESQLNGLEHIKKLITEQFIRLIASWWIQTNFSMTVIESSLTDFSWGKSAPALSKGWLIGKIHFNIGWVSVK